MSLLAQNVNRPEARLLYARQKSFSPDWPAPSYVHTGSELVFVLEGRGYFQIQGISHPLAGGGLLIIGPGVEHAQASEGSAPMSCVVLGVEGSSALLAPAAGWISAPLPDLLRELRPLLWAMVEENGQQREGFQLVCQNLLEVVLIRLSRGLRLELAPLSGTRKSSRECAVVRLYIDAHFKESITLDQLAALVHVNKYYLVHSFSREYGVSPISYLISRRVQESRRLLEGTSHSLAQISHMLGFSSPSYFSQTFRRQMGISPLEYRKRARAREDQRQDAVCTASAQ